MPPDLTRRANDTALRECGAGLEGDVWDRWTEPNTAVPGIKIGARGRSPSRHTLAYNSGNFMGTRALAGVVEHWPLPRLRETLIKIDAMTVRPGRDVIFQLAAAAILRS